MRTGGSTSYEIAPKWRIATLLPECSLNSARFGLRKVHQFEELKKIEQVIRLTGKLDANL
jgi:hypothetical protein